MEHLIDMTIMQACKQLPHVTLEQDKTVHHLIITSIKSLVAIATDGIKVIQLDRELYLNLWNSEPHSWPISKPSQIMIHILEDHINAPLVLVTLD
jgi:hypothetical protein